MNKIKWLNHFIELIIVILGISIAFSINKYSESRKDTELEIIYLESFLDEIINDIPKIDSCVIRIKEYTRTAEKLMIILKSQNRDSYLNEDSIEYYIGSGIGSIWRQTPTTITFESLKTSGKLEMISNFNLRKKIISYFETISSLEFILDMELQYFNENILNYFTETSKNDIDDYLDDDKLLIITGWRLNIYIQSLNRYKEIIQSAEDLKKSIEDELVILN